MTTKKHGKKVNHLTLKECGEILQKLIKDRESLYYQHVLAQYRKLMPAMSSAVTLGGISVEEGNKATLASGMINNTRE